MNTTNIHISTKTDAGICLRCGAHWDHIAIRPRRVEYEPGNSSFALCIKCWDESTSAERVCYHAMRFGAWYAGAFTAVEGWARPQFQVIEAAVLRASGVPVRIPTLVGEETDPLIHVHLICSQCGNDWSQRACGPTHAVIQFRVDTGTARVVDKRKLEWKDK